jgi:hypothetical protein
MNKAEQQSMSSGLITPSYLARIWEAGDKDVAHVLTALGVRPVSIFKYGRGVMRVYDPSVVNMRRQYEEYKAKSKQMLSLVPRPPIKQNIARAEENAQRLAAVEKSIAAINDNIAQLKMMLERLSKSLGVTD